MNRAGHRALRRRALLEFPDVSFNDATLDMIVAEGFDDLVLFPIEEGMLEGQGYSVSRAAELAARAHQRGLGVVVVTGYMKYEYDLLRREPHRAMLTRGPGATLDSDNLPSLWLCPFQEANQSRYRELLAEVAAMPGLTEVHLNDEAMLGFADGTIGCYCDQCVDSFEQSTGAKPPATANFDDPTWWQWIEWRMRGWTQVHAGFRDHLLSINPKLKVGIQHSPIAPCRCWQPWKTAVDVAADARALDVVTTDPYHFNHADVINQRPHRRIVAEATRSLVGACIGKAAGIYPQGFMPPGQAAPMGRQDGLLAGIVPFALGANSTTPYTYELMKIIPGYFQGFDDARRLHAVMQAHQPYAYSTMVYPLQSEMRGHPQENWGATYLNDAADLMYHAGIPWRWLWDVWLEQEAASVGPLILPEAHCLTAEQIEAVATCNGVLWIGNTPAAAWKGTGPCPLPMPLERGRYVIQTGSDHELINGIDLPIVLSSRTGRPPFEGDIIARSEGEPALVTREDNGRRSAWIAGLPTAADQPPGTAGTQQTGNLDLLRRVLTWLGRSEPTVCLDPWPAPDAYRAIRPADARCVPTAELLPMAGPDSLLAIVFPYLPVALETELVVQPPPGRQIRRASDLWTGQTMKVTGDGRIPVTLSGDTELLAVLIEWHVT